MRSRQELDRAWTYPFYLKLPHSTGGSGVFFVKGAKELNDRIERARADELVRRQVGIARAATGPRRSINRASRVQSW